MDLLLEVADCAVGFVVQCASRYRYALLILRDLVPCEVVLAFGGEGRGTISPTLFEKPAGLDRPRFVRCFGAREQTEEPADALDELQRVNDVGLCFAQIAPA